MSTEPLERLSDTLKISKDLIASNRKLTSEASSNSRKGEENIKNVYDSIAQLSDFRHRFKNQSQLAFSAKPSDEHGPKLDTMETAHYMFLHDIRSPLGRMVGLIEMIKQQGSLPPEVAHLIGLLEEQSQQVYDYTQTHSVYYQLEMRTYQPWKKPFDLVEFCQRLKDSMHKRSFINPIDIRINGRPVVSTSSCLVKEDIFLVELMLGNLLQNALEASPAGAPVRIDINCQYLDEEINPGEEPISAISFLSVHNHGVIPCNIRNRFFDKFATHGKPRGTGLGTYIAKLAVKALQGAITFETSEEQGTKLKIFLPGLPLHIPPVPESILLPDNSSSFPIPST